MAVYSEQERREREELLRVAALIAAADSGRVGPEHSSVPRVVDLAEKLITEVNSRMGDGKLSSTHGSTGPR